MRLERQQLKRSNQSGFTLVETVVSMAIVGIAMFSLYAGISLGFSVVNTTREDLRATQIMVEKMETIRLYSWDQIHTTNFVPTTFAEHYYPPGYGATNGWSSGVVYNGTLAFAPALTSLSYGTNLLQVTVDLSWTSNGRSKSRQMSTYITRDGLQNYIY